MCTFMATGSTLTNTVDINANNINVFNNGLKQYQNINEILWCFKLFKFSYQLHLLIFKALCLVVLW